ncbi:CHRD domain-containing protein [Nibrella saemangeumensis]
MKRKSFLLLLPAFLVGTLTFTACENDNDPDLRDTLNIVSTLSGRDVLPPNASSATGRFEGQYNKTTRVLTYTITHQGVTPTYINLHRAVQGTNGPVEIPLSSSATSPVTGTLTLTPAQENDLIFSNYYVLIGSKTYPDGELRGTLQIDRATPTQ